MSEPVAFGILFLLLLGPLLIRPIERNLEAYFLLIGLVSAQWAGIFDRHLAARAVSESLPISAAVIIAGCLFALVRMRLERAFEWLHVRMARPTLAALSVLGLAILSSLITAIIAALLLVEAVDMMRLGPRARVQVAVAGSFAIGICSALTPLGGPLSTLAAGALRLRFWGLFELLSVYLLPGTIGCAVLAGFCARGEEMSPARVPLRVRETFRDALIQGLKIFGFVAGLILIGVAFAPIAGGLVGRFSNAGLFWANSISAALDNSTLVALELHRMDAVRARWAIIALVVSGGMLIPGNIPNIIAAGTMKIGSGAWARFGVPLGAALMCIYFALLLASG